MPGGAQIVGQRLALLRERGAHESQKFRFLHAEFVKARRKPPSEHGRMHLGRRRKGARRQSKQRLHGPVHLHRHRQDTIIARPRAGDDPIGHLALHHQHCPVQGGMAGGQLQQDRRSDVVGQVSDNRQALARLSAAAAKSNPSTSACTTLTRSAGNCARKSAARSRSSSIAITCFARPARALVMAPRPGPISITVSPPGLPARPRSGQWPVRRAGSSGRAWVWKALYFRCYRRTYASFFSTASSNVRRCRKPRLSYTRIAE